MLSDRLLAKRCLDVVLLRGGAIAAISVAVASATAVPVFALPPTTCSAPTPSGPNLVVTCSTPGSADFVVPPGVTQVAFDVFGAEGGGPGTPGLGAKASATFNVAAGDVLTVDVGGHGGTNVGGLNGGGNGASSGTGGGGGGASDVRSSSTFLIVAGGGGGSGGSAGHGAGGAGGNPDGGAGAGDFPNKAGPSGGAGGSTSASTGGTGGTGGNIGLTQAGDGTNGSSMQGGVGGSGRPLPGSGTGSGGGGGGGGFFGGGGGGGGIGSQHGAGGGGGSSFGPTGTLFVRGAKTGDGEVVITYAAPPSPPPCTSNCTPPPGATPELDSLALFGAGGMGLLLYARRWRR